MGVIHPDITLAETLPSGYYNDSEKYSSLLEKFASTWNFIGLESMLENDNIVPVTIGDIPMILTKSESGYHCISNVCTHRGMILCDKKTTSSTISCPYHGRSFSLSGEFKHMPEFAEVKNFPSSADDLPSAQVVSWHGLLFASFSADETFEQYINAVEERMNFFNFSKLVRVEELDRLHKVSANWLLYVDNYLEGFHIPYVHKTLNSVIDYTSYQTELFDNAVLQIGEGQEVGDCFEIPEGHQDYGRNIAAYYWWIFPNLMLNFYPWGISVNVVDPLNVSQTNITYFGLVCDSSKIGIGAGGELDTVEHEDQWIVESCNIGMESKLYQRGRYSPTMEKGVHHFHRLLTE